MDAIETWIQKYKSLKSGKDHSSGETNDSDLNNMQFDQIYNSSSDNVIINEVAINNDECTTRTECDPTSEYELSESHSNSIEPAAQYTNGESQMFMDDDDESIDESQCYTDDDQYLSGLCDEDRNEDGTITENGLQKLPLDTWKDQKWDCWNCGKTFSKASDLLLHINENHQSIVRYFCFECSKLFNKYSSFVSHVRSKHKPHLKYW